MDISFTGDKKRRSSSSRARSPTTIHSLRHEILCTIFLRMQNLEHVINKSKLLRVFCRKQWQMGPAGSSNGSSDGPEEPWEVFLEEEMAVERHKLALHEGRIRVDHLRGHSVGLRVYPIPDKVPLVDFDFDESKVWLALVYAYGGGMG